MPEPCKPTKYIYPNLGFKFAVECDFIPVLISPTAMMPRLTPWWISLEDDILATIEERTGADPWPLSNW